MPAARRGARTPWPYAAAAGLLSAYAGYLAAQYALARAQAGAQPAPLVGRAEPRWDAGAPPPERAPARTPRPRPLSAQTNDGAADDAPCALAGLRGNTELDGSVVAQGGVGGLTAASAVECCRLCRRHRGCNVYVWSTAGDRACWLKRTEEPRGLVPSRARGSNVPWTSGVLQKDAALGARDTHAVLAKGTDVSAVVISTPLGEIRVRLMPDWHEPSARYVGAIAAGPREEGAAWTDADTAAVEGGRAARSETHAGLCTSACAFYRAEPGFLIQGSLRSLIPPNAETKEGPKLMERGDVGWAGGFSGPDFFIYLGEQPAAHFGRSHTVFARVEDEASLKVCDAIAHARVRPTRPNEMHMLAQQMPFDITAV